MRFPGFIGPSYTLQSVNVDCQRCVNLYPEVNALGTGKEGEVAALVSTPGLTLLCTLPTSPVRALWRASNDTLFAVGGNKVYKISSTFVATEIGSLNTSTGPVSVADNGNHVVFVDGYAATVWNIDTSAYTTITFPLDWLADQVTFQDGYFIFNKAGSGQFFISGLNDITIDPLDVSTAEGSPDDLVALISSSQNLCLFGKQSIEIFYNSGDADDPFARINGAVISVGCAAAFSIAKIESSLYWLGGDANGAGIVYRSQGYQAQRISTPAIESVIRGLDAELLVNARAWSYQQGGHHFYCLNLPGAQSTWVYDASTGFWHERTYSDAWYIKRHRADCHAVAYGENVVGDYETGALYSLNPDNYTDNGTPIARIRIAPHLSKSLNRLFFPSFQLDMETGVGTSGSGQGINPQVMLTWSDDGGASWSNEYWADAGKIGARKTRVLWRRLGSARDRVYQVKITDPVKVVLIGAEIGVQEGVT